MLAARADTTLMRLGDCRSDFLRTKDVAEVLGIKFKIVLRLIASKRLPAVKIGGAWIVPKKRLRALLEGLRDGCGSGQLQCGQVARARRAKYTHVQRQWERRAELLGLEQAEE
jgi:excisionase family DNA binding protein